MISLMLQDGRVLTFEPGAGGVGDTGLGVLREAEIVGIRSDDFSKSTALRRGPDFLLSDASRPDTLIAVEVKTGFTTPKLNQGYLRQLQPGLAKYYRNLRASRGQDIPVQLWLLTQDARELRTWEVNEQGESHDERQYHLLQVFSQEPEATDALLENKSKLTTREVTHRADDWEKRVRDLFETVKEWCLAISPDLIANDTETVVMHEELMQRYAVPPRDLPVLSVRQASDELLTFKPYGLWVIGGNGRIDIFSKTSSFFLVDRAARFQSSQWQLYGSGNKRIIGRRMADGIDFTVNIFEDLVRG